MTIEKFNHLKYLELEIMLVELSSLYPDFDFHSLVSFLDASPALETFILRVGLLHLTKIAVMWFNLYLLYWKLAIIGIWESLKMQSDYTNYA